MSRRERQRYSILHWNGLEGTKYCTIDNFINKNVHTGYNMLSLSLFCEILFYLRRFLSNSSHPPAAGLDLTLHKEGEKWTW